MTQTEKRAYDAIVIGSGIGGLAVASLLAQIGKRRVLVLEKHFKLGGFTHSFRRKAYEWDVGVHYVGEMYPSAMTRKIMDLVTGKGVDWHRMGHVVERLSFPQGEFEIPDDPAMFRDELIRRFPNERKNIIRYFKDVKRAQGWVARWFVSKQYAAPIDFLLTMGSRKLAQTLTADYLERFTDPLLKGILASQWPDFGSPPKESAFGFHATVTADFFHGGFYPVGGSQEIADHAERMIEQYDGECRVNHEVIEILTENGKASGVRAIHKGKEVTFTAPIVISDAGAVTTFQRLMPKGFCESEKRKAKRVKRGTSAMVLFLGLSADPRDHGFDDANYWIYDRVDHDTEANKHLDDPFHFDGAFLSFGSIRDPHQKHHTAQIISFSKASSWQKYSDGRWKKRGDEYEEQKEQLSQRLIDFVEKRVPGVRELISYHELATPLTVETFSGHEAGMIYGQACDPNRLTKDQWKIATSLRNFYLTGSDVGTPGVNGALMGAVMTAAKVLGPLGLPRIFARAYR